jgi:hypothetical protein
MLSGDLGSPEAFASTHWTPQRIIDVIEALCQERLLERRTASALEERFFVCMSANGTWL